MQLWEMLMWDYWQVEVRHEGLNKYRLITGRDKNVIEQKAVVQKAAWDEMWQKKLSKDAANEKSKVAEEAIGAIKNVLKHALNINGTISWEELKDISSFNKPKPLMPQQETVPNPPKITDPKYQPSLGFLDKVIQSRQENKINYSKVFYENDYRAWQEQKKNIHLLNTEREKQYAIDLNRWEAEKQNFLDKQKETNDAVEKRRKEYLDKVPEAIIEYCDLVLSESEYPDYFPQEFDIDYNPQNKILIVEYTLPSYDDMPKVKEITYSRVKGQSVTKFLSESTVNKLYDDLIYQIALRTTHELYASDVINAFESIVFNGWVKSIDRATGKRINPCILSIQASRQEFLSINLKDVDPKLCFKNLKGVGSSKLFSLTPIAPILNISREDKRFITSYKVADDLDESCNLAVMDWEDFEHLIRELFEKEFSQSGGEVKITRASRDSGVDAVAFDPDPIRGGKIVIQAKRYTNTVGVSAVRDLYGTVLNEGATKGILVTTTDYGPDAYEFAKGKPLTLLNGSNLLHLLEKHGHKAIIDLKAAKQILSEK